MKTYEQKYEQVRMKLPGPLYERGGIPEVRFHSIFYLTLLGHQRGLHNNQEVLLSVASKFLYLPVSIACRIEIV